MGFTARGSLINEVIHLTLPHKRGRNRSRPKNQPALGDGWGREPF